MIFADIASGESVFLDANTFVYHFGPDAIYGAACSQLLERIERNDLRGVTSTHVITEMAHRLMTIEAIATFGWPVAGIAGRLRRHADDVRKLIGFRRAVEAVLNSRVNVVTIMPQWTLQAAMISQQWGLLSNDALIVSAMQVNSIVHLASSDSDFDRVGGIARFGPA